MKIAKPKLVYSILAVISLLVVMVYPEFVDDSPISPSAVEPAGNGDSTTQPSLDEPAQ